MKRRTSKKKFWEILKGSRGFKVDQYDGIRNQDGICPVCHVANRILKKKKFKSEDVEEAATEIGLDHLFADDIVDAADATDASPYTRRLLLKTLNLEEIESKKC